MEFFDTWLLLVIMLTIRMTTKKRDNQLLKYLLLSQLVTHHYTLHKELKLFPKTSGMHQVYKFQCMFYFEMRKKRPNTPPLTS